MSFKISVLTKNNSGYFFLLSILNDMISVYGDIPELRQAKENLLKTLEGKENKSFKPNENDLWNEDLCDQTIKLMNQKINGLKDEAKENALKAKIKLRYPLEEAFRVYTNYIAETVNANLDNIFIDEKEKQNIDSALRDNEKDKILKTKEELKQKYVPFVNIAKQMKVKTLTNNDLLIAAKNTTDAIAKITDATHSTFANKINQEKFAELKVLYETVTKKGSSDFFIQPPAGKLTDIVNLPFQGVTRVLLWEKELKIDKKDKETFEKLKEATKCSLQVQNISKSISKLTKISNAMLLNASEIKIEINSETEVSKAAQIEIVKEAIEGVISKLELNNECQLDVKNNIITLNFNSAKAREKFLLGNNGLNSYNNEVNSFFYDTILAYLKKANEREIAGNKKSAEKYRKIANELIKEHNRYVDTIKELNGKNASDYEKNKALEKNVKVFSERCYNIIKKDSYYKAFTIEDKIKHFGKELKDKITGNIVNRKKRQSKQFVSKKIHSLKMDTKYYSMLQKFDDNLKEKLNEQYLLFARQAYKCLEKGDIAQLKKIERTYIKNNLELIKKYAPGFYNTTHGMNHYKAVLRDVINDLPKKIYTSFIANACRQSEDGKSLHFDLNKIPTHYRGKAKTILENPKQLQEGDMIGRVGSEIVIHFKDEESANDFLTNLNVENVTRPVSGFFSKQQKPVEKQQLKDADNENVSQNSNHKI